MRKIRDLLDCLDHAALKRLCFLRGKKANGGSDDLRTRLSRSYQGNFEVFIDALRKTDLVSIFDEWVLEDNDGCEYKWASVRGTGVQELKEIALKVLVEGWRPTRDGQRPSRKRNALAKVYLMDLDDEDDFEEEPEIFLIEDDDDEDDWGDDDEVGASGIHSSLTVVEIPESSDIPPLASFQKQAIENLDQHFKEDLQKAGLLVLPTGGGKTRTSMEFLLRIAIGYGGGRVLWLAHRKELLDQAFDEAVALAGVLAGTDQEHLTISRYDGTHKDLSGDLIIASTQSIISQGTTLRRVERHGGLTLLCYDEAHHAVARETHKALKRLRGKGEDVPILGLTATPFRRTDSGTTRLLKLFGEEPVFECSFKELVDLRFLARPVFMRHRLNSTEVLELDEDEIRYAKHRDIPSSVLGRLARNEERNHEIVSHWLENRGHYGKSIVFCCDIKHAERLSELFGDAGIAAACVHYALEREVRNERLEEFDQGDSQVLLNVNILTEGVDLPNTRTVVMARPTTSPVLYRQMIGRGARGPAVVPDKDRFFVLDCVDNFEQHGLVLAGREVAEDLSDEFKATDAEVILEAASPEEVQQRRQQAVLAAQTWLDLTDFAPEQYTLWGELVWEQPDGGTRSVAVFSEGIPSIRAAVDDLKLALGEGCAEALHSRGDELDHIGVIRGVDWHDMLDDCIHTGAPPRLEKISDFERLEPDTGLIRMLSAAVRRIREEALSVDRVRTLCESLLASNDALRERFQSADAFQLALVKLCMKEGVAGEVTAGLLPHVQAMLRLAVGISKADGYVHPAEVTCIRKAATMMPGCQGGRAREQVDALIQSAREGDIDVKEEAMTLKASVGLIELNFMLERLLEVMVADGRVVQVELGFLHGVAAALDLPTQDLEERARRLQSLMAPLPRNCPKCGHRPDPDALFCCSCGTRLAVAEQN